MNRNTILQVDITGTPQDWISPETAATMICNDNVAWTSGPTAAILRGGWSRLHDRQSMLEIPAIIGSRGSSKVNLQNAVPPLTSNNVKLFERDCHMCAYCGFVGTYRELNREHIIPVSRGGKNVWTNVVTACKPCNSRKGNATPEEMGLSLLYLPYEPNLFEDFILQRGGRRILADQMEFLLARVPPHSRLRQSLC